ncbi:MAG: hypothetical protein CMG59_05770, partial [Candidatus Marinimicrobia bacterium]|nr:hypothetical protein [Candidatus Neomarinimicrobiota bacterium]
KNLWTGWHLFGAPLVPEFQTMEDNLGILGNFGDSWIAYDQDGNFQDLELPLGQGFYLALSQDSNVQLSGDPVISSDLSLADLKLDKGWTLAANPIVNIVDKNTLEVVYDGESKSYSDAVLAGWIAPHVVGWFEDTHYPADHLVPFGGYWFHTSRELTVKVRPHLPIESSARLADNAFSINLSAQPVDGLSGGDFVNMSVKDGANDSFKYGEDEFDHPNPAMSSFVDLYFNKNSWIGAIDENGVMVDNPYFSHDVRSSDIENHVWNISGKSYNVTGDINLNWSMSDTEQEAYLLVGNEIYDMREVSSITVSSIDDMTVVMGDLEAYLAPSEFGLSASYPNPFNPTTSMNLSLNESGYVSVNVYNVMGQIVSTLVDGNMEAGYHTLTWNADNMPSGMYLVRVQSGSNIETQKLMLLK